MRSPLLTTIGLSRLTEPHRLNNIEYIWNQIFSEGIFLLLNDFECATYLISLYRRHCCKFIYRSTYFFNITAAACNRKWSVMYAIFTNQSQQFCEEDSREYVIAAK
jgi:hypothetical protein